MDLTLREAALIKFLRDTNEFTNVTIIKVNGKIERIRNEELRTIKDLAKEYGLLDEIAATNGNGNHVRAVDNQSKDVIVE